MDVSDPVVLTLLLLVSANCGAVFTAFFVWRKARQEYRRAAFVARRTLEGIDRGHLLKVIEQEAKNIN